MTQARQDPSLTTSLGMPSLSISLKISRAVLGCFACTLTAMREFMQYVFGLRPASFIIWTACKDMSCRAREGKGDERAGGVARLLALPDVSRKAPHESGRQERLGELQDQCSVSRHRLLL